MNLLANSQEVEMITEYILNHQTECWFIFGFLMLALEVVTGLTTGIFLFGGLGALATGLLMSVGVLPETWIAGVSSTGISSGIITLILWVMNLSWKVILPPVNLAPLNIRESPGKLKLIPKQALTPLKPGKKWQ
jgi:hypothetical protein